MAKKLACGGLIPGCDFVAEAETEGELMVKVVEHAKGVHGIDTISEEMLATVLENIKEA